MAFIHFNMPTCEFIEHLRDGAIKARLAPQVIDQIDSLYVLYDMEDEVEKANAEATEAEENASDLRGALEDLINTLQNDGPEEYPPAVEAQIKLAEAALERCDK